MSGWSWLHFGANLLATLFKPITKAILVCSRPVLRLWNLSKLRSEVVGLVPVSTQFDGPAHVFGTGHLRLDEHCRLGRNVQFETSGAGEIEIGKRVRINAGCVIVANCSLHIGDDTLIGEYVSIRDANHGIAPGSLIRSQSQLTGPIRIGCNVWIGRGSCILKGVTIGDGAVVGANSVVTHDVPEGAIFAGVPAKQLGTRDRM